MKLFSNVWLSQRAITIQCDIKNAICLVKNPTFHRRQRILISSTISLGHDIGWKGDTGENIDTLENLVDVLK